MKYQVQLVWNREFNWCNYAKPYNTIEEAKAAAISIRDSGDGGRVKKVQVVDIDTGTVVWKG